MRDRISAEETPSVKLDFAYTGKYFDAVTELSLHWNRWYDPKSGKWISVDPIGFAGGDTNLYRYVGNSSNMFLDPDGQARLRFDDEKRIKIPSIYRPDGTLILRPGANGMVDATLEFPSHQYEVNTFGGTETRYRPPVRHTGTFDASADPMDIAQALKQQEDAAPYLEKIQEMYGGNLTAQELMYLALAIARASRIAHGMYDNAHEYKDSFIGIQCSQYASEITKCGTLQEYVKKAGFEVEAGDVYVGHSGAVFYRPNSDGTYPDEFFIIHVGSGIMPRVHTRPGSLWPLKFSFPGGWLTGIGFNPKKSIMPLKDQEFTKRPKPEPHLDEVSPREPNNQ